MNIAFFDFDGTISDREMFVAFLEHAVERRRLVLCKVVLAPLVVGYKSGLISSNRIRAIAVRAGLSGAAVTAVEEHANSFGTSVLPGVIRPIALERIRWHQSRGDKVVVVTAALEVALKPWCVSHQLELLGSVLAQRDGKFTGCYSGPQCAREHKASRIKERYDLAQYDAVYVYGDTADDFAMLDLASHGYYRWQEYKSVANRSPERAGDKSRVS